MHFPEEQLITYLRVFLPQDQIEAVLDEVAEAALKSDVDDEIGFFSLAHWLMQTDDRRTDEMEAVVLVEEVGFPAGDVAIILDMTLEVVQQAVQQAWVEAVGMEEGETDQPTDSIEPEPAREQGPDPDPDEPEHGQDQKGVRVTCEPLVVATPVDDSVPRGICKGRITIGRVLAAIGVVGLIVLGIAVFSVAGQARLLAQGFNPKVAFLVVSGLVVAGGALLLAGGSDRDESATSAKQTPTSGQ
ncbi:MAG: hypothetical protein ACR2HR_05460 [Euzebya sp.]